MDQTAQLQEMLNALGGTVNNTSGAFQQLSQVLANASRATGQNATANSTASQAMQQFQQRQQAASSALTGLGSTATGLINGMTAVTSSMYGADKAFTGAIPTLMLVTETMTRSLETLGKGFSGATVSLGGLSVNLGRASEAIAQGLITPINAMSGLLRFGLEASQKVADAYLDVAKNGALFGASIGEFARSAARANIPMQSFQKIIVDNAENINKLGIGMQRGGLAVAGMAEELMHTNDSLVALYGSIENLAAGTAEYLSLQSDLGANIKNDYDKNLAGAKEYLIRQKELSALTGKRAADLKREEEERRNQLDYNLKAGRLNREAQENLREAMGVAGRLFGPTGAKYLEEYFATGGNVYSEQAIKYEALNNEAANAMRNMLGGMDQGRDAFRQNYQEFLKANAPALEASAKQLEDLASINRNANHSTITLMTETSVSIQKNLTAIKTGLEEIDLKKFREGLEKPLDDPTKGFVTAQKALMENQRAIDDMVIKNMGKMAEVTTALYKINLMLLSGQDAAIEAVKGVVEAAKQGKQALEDYGKKWQAEFEGKFLQSMQQSIGNKAWQNPTPANQVMPGKEDAQMQETVESFKRALSNPTNPMNKANGSVPEPNMPKRAEGGIADTPSIAGEAGPEAVIPLKGGKIPLQIDFDPVVKALQENNSLMERLSRSVEDSKDIQQRILNASY